LKISKEMIVLLVCCALLIAGAVGMELLKNEKSNKPSAVVTNFKGDPMTSRAFTWHSADLQAEAIVQIMKGVEEKSWEDGQVMTFKARHQ